ncbi:MAG: hypothetical protein WDN23_11870 [Edaphobacter sp.]
MRVSFSIAALFYLLHGAVVCLLAQDSRNVTEAVFPATCAVLQAPLQSTTTNGPSLGNSLAVQDASPWLRPHRGSTLFCVVPHCLLCSFLYIYSPD